jgi:hypothetical protein
VELQDKRRQSAAPLEIAHPPKGYWLNLENEIRRYGKEKGGHCHRRNQATDNGKEATAHLERRQWNDSGTEFYNKKFKSLLKSIGADIYSTYNDSKAVIAERFIRTLKGMIWKRFLTAGDRKWLGILGELVNSYNNKVHRTLGMTPSEAREEANVNKVRKGLRPPKAGKPRYGLGDWVRIANKKGIFEKGFHPTFSYQIYKIVGVNLTSPVTYLLEDYYGETIDGSFYEADIVPVADPTFFPVEKVLRERTSKGEREKLVKFLGYKEPRRPATRRKKLKPPLSVATSRRGKN